MILIVVFALDGAASYIELNLGTAAERTDMCPEVTPAEARVIAHVLLALADTAERDEPPQAHRS